MHSDNYMHININSARFQLSMIRNSLGLLYWVIRATPVRLRLIFNIGYVLAVLYKFAVIDSISTWHFQLLFRRVHDDEWKAGPTANSDAPCALGVFGLVFGYDSSFVAQYSDNYLWYDLVALGQIILYCFSWCWPLFWFSLFEFIARESSH